MNPSIKFDITSHNTGLQYVEEMLILNVEEMLILVLKPENRAGQ